jgi:threonine dehydrogenase-like Zn-dependent dehydrogenase
VFRLSACLCYGDPADNGDFEMKALYYPAWGKLEVKDVPMPSPADGEVLVRVANCGVCGSELETFREASIRRTPPLIMGHEFCGQVEEVGGAGGNGLKGRRVIAHALVHCGECSACLRGDTNLCVRRHVFGMHRPGAFAEYVSVPERVLIPWPDGLPAAAAVFAEPLANGINAMRQGPTARKSRVAVIGAGPIGLMCLFAAKRVHQSSVVISDRIPERLDAARVLGADLTVNALRQNLETETMKYWSGERAEFVIDAVGSSETKRLSLDLVEPGGMVVWVGLHEDRMNLNSYALTLGQKCVSGSYSGSIDDLRQAAQILSAGNFPTSWATQYSLDEGEAGFRDMLQGKGNKIKAILQFQEGV